MARSDFNGDDNTPEIEINHSTPPHKFWQQADFTAILIDADTAESAPLRYPAS